MTALTIVALAALRVGGGLGQAEPAAPPPPAPPRCDRSATDAATLATAFAAATPGQVICLGPGDYGVFNGGAKPGPVTVRSRSGTTAKLALDFESVGNVRISSVTVPSARIAGRSHDITIERSRFTGLAFIDASRLRDADIRLDANRHVDIDTCATCFQGRVQVDGRSRRRAGVVISRSLFAGGDSDGVRAGARGVEIIENEFTGMHGSAAAHTDPIQIYGGTEIVIRRNFIHDNEVSAGVMMADGGRGNVVEDNVISGTTQTWAMTWYSDVGSIIRHNTFPDGACEFERRCGTINLGAKDGSAPGRGTVIRDNVLGGVVANGATFEADHNLSRDPLPGAANVAGLPAFEGSAESLSGHRLADDSPGAGTASDGGNPGVR